MPPPWTDLGVSAIGVVQTSNVMNPAGMTWEDCPAP